MSLVVFLRGVNVGGHRTFRPTTLVRQLRHLDAVNIGAAGTFVVRRPVRPARLRSEIVRRLPFAAEIVICQGAEIARLLAGDIFGGRPPRPEVVRFVSVLCGRPRAEPPLPLNLPSSRWLLKVLARQDRFVLGLYRRQMKAIGLLGRLDRLYGVPLTTRNWTTMAAIGRVLEGGGGAARS